MDDTKLMDRYRRAARRLWHEDGQIEVDESAEVSLMDDPDAEQGAYVQAWVYVSAKELGDA